MKIGAVIICRYNSSRLPGKILKTVEGQPILYHIIKRLQSIPELDVVIATSNQSTDDPISEYAVSQTIPCYRGSLENVSSRFLNASLHYDFDYAIRVNGDNLFIDINTVKKCIALASNNVYDFISNVKNRTFPYGMSVEIVKIAFYRQIIKNFNTSYYNEHVTIYLYENEQCGNFHFLFNTELPKAAGLKLAIDTAEDLENARQIVKKMPEGLRAYSLSDLVNIL